MAILTKHFEVHYPEANIRKIDVPGLTGPVMKKISGNLPSIVQTGWMDNDAGTRATLVAGVGDPSTVASVDTLIQGTFTNCMKSQAKTVGVPTGYRDPTNGPGKIRYEILYQQLCGVVT